MDTLIALGLKSLLVAGVTLAILHHSRRRSAADRSWIAHLGLFALVALPLASLALPALSVELPAALQSAAGQSAAAGPLPAAAPVESDDIAMGAASSATSETSAIDWAPYAYAVPAVMLLLVTLIALLRLFGLRSRAQVLVDPVWLSALAHAQRRMGYKNGTALLVSSELSSPISWGLMRPVILLNDEALGASGEAEAIIAHELAHVARLDWAKLMLARIATAVFWFNPLAWVLAREAHQLREEAADDAVLGADIADTDYAQLLVGVARHECRGLLIGAHGISPGKGSLRRRVSRVLDSSLSRVSGGRSWVAGFAAGMLVMAAPLAALTFSPPPPPPAPPRPLAAPQPPEANGPPEAPAHPAAPLAPDTPLAPPWPRAPKPVQRAYPSALAAPEAPSAVAAPAVPQLPTTPWGRFERDIAITVSTVVSTSLDAAADELREANRGMRKADQGLREADRGMREADRGLREADRAGREADQAGREADQAARKADRAMREAARARRDGVPAPPLTPADHRRTP